MKKIKKLPLFLSFYLMSYFFVFGSIINLENRTKFEVTIGPPISMIKFDNGKISPFTDMKTIKLAPFAVQQVNTPSNVYFGAIPNQKGYFTIIVKDSESSFSMLFTPEITATYDNGKIQTSGSFFLGKELFEITFEGYLFGHLEAFDDSGSAVNIFGNIAITVKPSKH